MNDAPSRRGGGAAFVAAGILLSRLFGLVRNRLLGHFLGTGDAADAFYAAIKIPNLLQNLFGEGVLSASFIPVYSRLLAEGDREEAGRVAGAVGALLALTSTVLVVLGVALAPVAIPLIAPGFIGEKRDLTILLVQVMFPGVGLLVLSAWALGVLNSHGRFFLSYVSPVAMNVVMIVALLWFGPDSSGDMQAQAHLATMVAWASVAGSAAQLLVQLPTLWSFERRLRVVARTRVGETHVRTVLRNFLPVFLGRGVVQVSGYVDSILASLIVAGSVAMLGYAQVIAMLPVSLFGMSVAAAELPAMSSLRGSDAEVAAALRAKLHDGLRRIAFYVVPSAAALLLLGDVIGAMLYRTGAFTRSDVVWLWQVLAGSSVGLLASTLGRLYASAWYALRDTKTPLRFAMIRVVLTIVLGYVAALRLPGWLGIDLRWGVAGLTATAGIAAWVEFWLLRRSIARRLGGTDMGGRYVATLWFCALLAAGAAWLVKLGLGTERPVLLGLVALPVYGGLYLLLAGGFGIAEVSALRRRMGRLLARD